MHSAITTVLTDSVLFAHVVSFQSGLPYVVLACEPKVYNHRCFHSSDPRGACLLHHALLTDSKRMVDLLFRLREQPYYAAMPQFAFDGVRELVCKQGSVQHLELLQDKLDRSIVWPSNLLRVTLDALEYPHTKLSPEEQAAFQDEQRNQAMWLMERHPEACADPVRPRGVLLSDHGLRDFLLTLLAANVVDMSSFSWYGNRDLDGSLLELLLRKYPRAISPQLVEGCASHGNLEALQFLHGREHELPTIGLFTPAVMDAAAKNGHLEVVRFLHENRAEGCTQRAIDNAVLFRHLDVVKFLLKNRTGGFSPGVIESTARFGGNDQRNVALVQCLVEHHPEAIQDPTSWPMNRAVKHVWSTWAKHAVVSDDPVQALRAAAIHVTDATAFKNVHEQNHPTACTGEHNTNQSSLLKLAIDAQNDAEAAYLVENCEHVRASIGFSELFAIGSHSRALNVELLDLLLAKRSRVGGQTERVDNDLLQCAAEASNLPFVKALLERGVPCSENVLLVALESGSFDVPEYLMDTYPDQITEQVMYQVAYRGEHEYLFKLHATHPHLWDSSLVFEILCGRNSHACTTWEAIRSLYERCSSTPLAGYIARRVWQEDHADVLLFMWLVWQDPQLAPSLASAERGNRLRLYVRLRELVPSLFAKVPVTLPWCCQLRFLRRQVESGELTLVDVERARREVTPQTATGDMAPLASY